MSTCAVLRFFIEKKPNWKSADVIELDFTIFEMRTVKIFVDSLYGLETENVYIEDLLKLLRLVHQHGTEKDRDYIQKTRKSLNI